ncbi:MAG TPA: alkaline phosphatase family protein [Caulobacteraceae bacterium]|jgi:arylsulfatase A-like enzyme|nr:alkaline phosphatase family protein [Caulobacteraceae bacterium]
MGLRRHPRLFAAVAALALTALVGCGFHPRRHNLIIFVADGLRSGMVTPQNAPTMAAIRADGVDFHNSHALFPTVTTANASAIATGHRLGDTGDFANTIFPGDPVLPAVAPSHVAMYEDDATLGDMNKRYGGNYLNETSLLEAARKAGYQTAAVGKLGPISIQDVTARDGKSTLVIDDLAGAPASQGGLPLPQWVKDALKSAGLDASAPDRGLNGDPGDAHRAGVRRPNDQQQNWFTAVATQILLPRFKDEDKPFVMVFWSLDPDGTQHNTGDSLNQLTPGINGPTSLAGIKNADNDLGRIRKAVHDLGLEDSTDIVVTADHGFSTISRQSATSATVKRSWQDVMPRFLPPGFFAIDLSQALALPLRDANGLDINLSEGFHPGSGSALIGEDTVHPDIVIGANGGADLLWFNGPDPKTLARRAVQAITQQDYVGAIFVDDSLGPIPGALPMSAIGLVGSARTPRPSMIVSFKSFSTGCADPELCAAEIAETSLQQGQGIHGSFSRADTHNFMAAIGPDFRRHYVDPAPASNADLAPTLAKIFGFDLGGHGKLGGRVLKEARRDGDKAGDFTSEVMASQPAANGFKTVLHYQRLGDQLYYDYAGMPGRVVE